MQQPPRLGLAKGLWVRFRDADVSIMAAAVAYNTFLALVPLTFGLLAAAALIGQDTAALARVERTLALMAPADVVEFVTGLLTDAEARVAGQAGLIIPVSLGIALLFGSRAVAALQKAMARVEHMVDTRKAWRTRAIAVALTIGGGLAFLATSLMIVAGRRLVDFLAELWGWDGLVTLWLWIRIPVSGLGILVFLLAFYHWGPPVPLPRPWLAAIVATAGVMLVSFGFDFYLGAAPDLGATFGALGAVAIALVWLYLSAFMILLGAVLVAYILRWRVDANVVGIRASLQQRVKKVLDRQAG